MLAYSNDLRASNPFSNEKLGSFSPKDVLLRDASYLITNTWVVRRKLEQERREIGLQHRLEVGIRLSQGYFELNPPHQTQLPGLWALRARHIKLSAFVARLQL